MMQLEGQLILAILKLAALTRAIEPLSGSRLYCRNVTILNRHVDADARPAANQLTAGQVRHCLAGRNVYIFGNSVARHWAFVLADWLSVSGEEGVAVRRRQGKVGGFEPYSGPHSNRTQEKLECGRGGVNSASIYGATSIRKPCDHRLEHKQNPDVHDVRFFLCGDR